MDSAQRRANQARQIYDAALADLADALRNWLTEEGITRRELASAIPFTSEQVGWQGKVSSLICINGGLQFFDEDGDEVDMGTLDVSTVHAIFTSALAEREDDEDSTVRTWRVLLSMKSSKSNDEVGRPTYERIAAPTEARAIADARGQARAAAACTGWREGDYYLELISAVKNNS